MGHETSLLVVLTTTDSRAVAEQLARHLVEIQAAACVQINGPVTSVYRWEGQIQQEQEWSCWIKTTEAGYERVVAGIGQVHPYEVPEILALSVQQADRAYADWVHAQVPSVAAEPDQDAGP